MPSEFFYFMAVGGLGVTLAGFAGLIAALQGPEGPVAAWRIRNVVYTGFAVTFIGFVTVALFTLTQNITLTAQLGSLALLAMMAGRWREMRPSAAWPSERQRRGFILSSLVFALAVLVNLALASVGYLQLLLLFALGSPIGIFARAVQDVTAQADAGWKRASRQRPSPRVDPR
jgi:hypothetical protein